MNVDLTPQITAMHDAVYDLLLSNINDSPTSGEAINARAVMNAAMDELCKVISPFKAMKMLHNVIASFDDEAFQVMGQSQNLKLPIGSDSSKSDAISSLRRARAENDRLNVDNLYWVEVL